MSKDGDTLENDQVETITAMSTSDVAANDGEVWRPWPTFWLGLGIGVTSFFVQVIVVAFFAIVRIASNPRQDVLVLSESLSKNGLLLIVSGIASELVVIGLVLLVIRLRKGWTISEYLAFRPISSKVLLAALIAISALVAVSDGITHLSGRPIVPQFEIDLYRSGVSPLLAWILLIVTAPITEEIVFRGFLLEGFRRSRMGNIGAVVVTAIMWGSLHLQYDIYNVGIIVATGLLLGAVRLKSRSLWPCIAMHSLMNLIATVELVVHMRSIGG
ncbi:MAG TPA: CPBP family intramembrane glutamic endopeptidase [Armatimonadota bacterium]